MVSWYFSSGFWKTLFYLLMQTQTTSEWCWLSISINHFLVGEPPSLWAPWLCTWWAHSLLLLLSHVSVPILPSILPVLLCSSGKTLSSCYTDHGWLDQAVCLFLCSTVQLICQLTADGTSHPGQQSRFPCTGSVTCSPECHTSHWRRSLLGGHGI